MIRKNVDVIAITLLLAGFAVVSTAQEILKAAPIAIQTRVAQCDGIPGVVRAVTIPFIRASE